MALHLKKNISAESAGGNKKYTEANIAQMVGEYFFAVRNGGSIKKTDRIPDDLPEDLRIELESTYLFVDLILKLQKIEKGESVLS